MFAGCELLVGLEGELWINMVTHYHNDLKRLDGDISAISK